MSKPPDLAVPEINDVQLVFPADALDWMPAYDDIPAEYRRPNPIAESWFFRGLPATVEFYPRKGVDPEKALRAIKATLGSYAPRHEHKMAAVSLMLDAWFKRVEGWQP